MINNDEVNILISITAVTIFYCVGIIFIAFLKSHDRLTLTKIFSLAFFLRVATVFILYFYLLSIGGDGFVQRDDRKYDLTASEISHEISLGNVGYKQYGVGWANIGYFNLNGWLYRNLDFDTLSSRMVNVIFSSLTVILFYLIFETLFDRKRAAVLGYTLALFPNSIFWASTQFKDTAIIFCSAVLMYILICKFRQKINLLPVLAFVFFAGCLWFLRKDYCLPYFAVVLLLVFLKYTKLETLINDSRRSFFPKMAIISILGISIISAILLSKAGTEFTGTIEHFSESQSSIVRSGYGFSRHLRIVSITDIYKLPAAMAFTAIAPLPSFANITIPEFAGTSLHSLANAGLVFGLPFVIIGFFLFKGEKVLFTDRLLLKWIPLIMLCALSIVYIGNLRYKATLLVYFACWASLTIYERKRLKGKLLAIYGLSLLAIVMILPIAIIFR